MNALYNHTETFRTQNLIEKDLLLKLQCKKGVTKIDEASETM